MSSKIPKKILKPPLPLSSSLYFQEKKKLSLSLKSEQGISDNEFYHYDTPLTVEHETEALKEAGFSSVEVLKNWGATYTIKAVK